MNAGVTGSFGWADIEDTSYCIRIESESIYKNTNVTIWEVYTNRLTLIILEVNVYIFHSLFTIHYTQ